MIIFLFGKEKYLISKRLLDLRNAFERENERASVFDVDLEDGLDEKEMGEILSGGSGLFSEKKLVTLRNAASLNNFDAENLQEKLKKTKEGDDLIVIIAEIHSKDEKGKLISYLKRSAKSEKFDKLSLAAARDWIADEVKKRSEGEISMEESAVQRLAEISKNDLWKISSELDKLIGLVSQGQISRRNIDDFCAGGIEVKIFDLVDVIGKKRTAQAIKLKNQLISQGENEFYVFKMIMFQVRNILKVHQCFKRGMRDPKAISAKLGMHPFVAQKTSQQLAGFNSDKLKKAYELATEIDLKSKSGEVKMEEVLDYFILKICNS